MVHTLVTVKLGEVRNIIAKITIKTAVKYLLRMFRLSTGSIVNTKMQTLMQENRLWRSTFLRQCLSFRVDNDTS